MRRRIIPDVIGEQVLAKLPPSAKVREAARLMRDRRVGSVLVVRDGRLAGIFTTRDLVDRVVAAGLSPERTRLDAVMTSHPDTIQPSALAMDALRRMQDGGYGHLPVVDHGSLVGIVSGRDFSGEEKARLDYETRLWERL